MKQPFFYEPQHDRADIIKFFRSIGGHTPPHFHRCIEILYITDGSIDCEIGGEKFFAEKDDIVFTHKCAVHELIPAPEYNDLVLIIGQSYSDDFSGIFQKQTLPAHLADSAFNRTLRPYFDALGEACNRSGAGAELVQKGLVDVIVGSLLGHYERVPATATPALGTVVAVLNYIDDHFDEPITLESISASFGYNKYYFSRLFNRYVGENLNNYINTIRVRNLVARAQKEEDPRLASLVFECGFDSMTTFYRSFARCYNCPPSEVFKKHG